MANRVGQQVENENEEKLKTTIYQN